MINQSVEILDTRRFYVLGFSVWITKNNKENTVMERVRLFDILQRNPGG